VRRVRLVPVLQRDLLNEVGGIFGGHRLGQFSSLASVSFAVSTTTEKVPSLILACISMACPLSAGGWQSFLHLQPEPISRLDRQASQPYFICKTSQVKPISAAIIQSKTLGSLAHFQSSLLYLQPQLLKPGVHHPRRG
jgi:hypothetical protein